MHSFWRYIPVCLAILTALPVCSAVGNCVAAVSRPPNVILIVADGLGFEWLGCYGDYENRTPCLDASARMGMRFCR